MPPRALLLVAGLHSCLARECGQAEVDARDISGCGTVLHMKYLGHQGAVWLGDALHHNPHLEFLDLHHTDIGDDDAQSLADGLHNNTFLKRIALHNNRITDKGAAALGNALAHNDALEFLSLSSNGVGDAGAVALAAGLRANRALRRLDLYFNRVGDEGARALAAALEGNRGLRTLHLDTNRVGDEGGLALCRVLATGAASAPAAQGSWFGGRAAAGGAPLPSMGELTLMYNYLTNAAAAVCMDAARDNARLHKLTIEHNHDVHGEVRERLKGEHQPRMAERHAIASWLVAQQLVPDGFHSPDGPPLASPHARAVADLRLHTKAGVLALRHEDAAALAARPELRALPDDAARAALAEAIRAAVAAATARDEL